MCSEWAKVAWAFISPLIRAVRIVLREVESEKLFSLEEPAFLRGEERFCRCRASPRARELASNSVTRATRSVDVVVARVAFGADEHGVNEVLAVAKARDEDTRDVDRRGSGGYSSAMKIVIRWLLLAAALLLVAQIYGGVVVSGFGAALIAAFVIGLFNTLLRPILVLLTLPVTVLTLGLFLFVINALMFYFAAGILQGFQVNGFVGALVGSLLYSLCGLVIDAAMERMFERPAS